MRGAFAVAAPAFDLALTLRSGQVFHWEAVGDGFAGMIGEEPVLVTPAPEVLRCRGSAPERVRHYFALDHPLEEICASFPEDAALAAARDFCRGMRIIRQPLWECLATFITSSMKQVAHIRQMSHALRRRWGKLHRLGGHELWAYPTPAALAAADEAALRACGLGYRAPNLRGAAEQVASGAIDLEAIRALGDDEARAALCALPGVGVKVANCVLLFAYERLRSFPIDVWIERVLRERYFARKRKITPRRLAEFSAGYFGAYGGYAQQYLFHHARQTWKQRRGCAAIGKGAD